jgi:cell wall-associated NlpC family hydrolase
MNGTKVVEIAQQEIGYQETPKGSNKTKYGEWFGMDGVPWCAIFVSWVYAQAGFPLGNIGFTKGFAGTRTGLKYFRDNRRTTFYPAPGDIVFFDWDLNEKVDHVGIFVKWLDNDYFESIEGNTGTTSQSNGGEVMLKKRHKKFAKFVHPKSLD